MLVVAMTTTAVFSQKTSFEDLEFFDKIILKGNVSRVIVEQGSREVRIDGVSEEQVEISRNASTLTFDIAGNNSVEVIISNGSLRWIEASENVEIEGVGFLKGGSGKFLVTGRDLEMIRNWRDYEVNVDIGDLDFDFDFDFDFDYDFDFDMDFDEDFKKEVKVKIKDTPKVKSKVKIK